MLSDNVFKKCQTIRNVVKKLKKSKMYTITVVAQRLLTMFINVKSRTVQVFF